MTASLPRYNFRYGMQRRLEYTQGQRTLAPVMHTLGALLCVARISREKKHGNCNGFMVQNLIIDHEDIVPLKNNLELLKMGHVDTLLFY